MELPFSHDAFLDVFGVYNSQLWPVVVLLWLATAIVALRWFARAPVNSRVIFSLLAAHWGWSGVVYHWGFFRAINPAATLFGALFVVQAAVFAWLAFKSPASAAPGAVRRLVGAAVVAYGLAYPFLNLGLGLAYPRLPLFAVPCPTTLVTAGVLVTCSRVPRFVNVVPILWAAVASSAALLLGVRADLALVPVGVLLVIDTIAPSALGRRPQPQRPQPQAASVN